MPQLGLHFFTSLLARKRSGQGHEVRSNERQAMVSVTATEFVAVERRKTSKRRELTEAYAALLLFMSVYWARPTDWIPGLSTVPLAKIAAALAFVALALSLSQIRHRLPPEVGYVFLLIAQLVATAVMSPVWKGGALQTTLDFAKVGLI